MTDATLYERLGGHEGSWAVVDAFYDKLVADVRLGPFFEDAALETLRETQTAFLCEAAGGPETYDAEPVQDAHLHVPFTAADIQRALELLEQTLDEFDVPDGDAEAVVGAYEAELLATPDEE